MMLEPQEGLTYDDLLAVARRVEATGLDGLYRSDHYASVNGREGLASTDAWATLAGLARDTSRIRLGTLVSPATFRTAGNLAKVVATVSEMAGAAPGGGARVSLGLGTGWLETEHRQYGFPFEQIGVRFDRLEEHLAAVRGLWDPERDPFDLDGRHVRMEGAVFRRKPEPRPRIVVGGGGMRRTPELAARYGDELNNVFAPPQRCVQQRAALVAACEAQGRDPATVAYSLMTGCIVGATQQEFEARVRRLQERMDDGRAPGEFLAERSETWILGTPDQAAERIGAFDAGVEAVMLQHLAPDDLDMIDLVAAELAL
jgi:alkanesulfonate monooxygenase SsuD/methylene tetrahydromethanopterin reductase-like flavin-dependent oxidoreductase (luciferase family)